MKTENPHDLLQKGRLYDALKKRNDELVEVLRLVLKDVEWDENSPTKKLIKQALKNNEND